jgi:hypothetical protein
MTDDKCVDTVSHYSASFSKSHVLNPPDLRENGDDCTVSALGGRSEMGTERISIQVH